MPRIRTLKPEFWTDERVGELTRDERLLFLGLISTADDQGRFRAAAATVRAMVFPQDDDVTKAMVEEWLRSLHRVGVVVLYDVNGSTYGAIAKWSKHQKVDHPARPRIPAPPCDASQSSRGDSEITETLAPHTTDHRPPTTDHRPHDSFEPPADGRSQPSDALPLRLQLTDAPEPPLLVFPTVGRGGKTWGLTKKLVGTLQSAFPGVEIMAEARKALSWCETRPTERKTAGGMPKFLHNWMSRAQNNSHQRPAAPPPPERPGSASYLARLAREAAEREEQSRTGAWTARAPPGADYYPRQHDPEPSLQVVLPLPDFDDTASHDGGSA